MPTPSPGHRTGTMNAPSCWAHLASARVGRLSFHTGRGDRAIMVPYALSSDGLSSGVLLRLPAYNQAAGYVPGRKVTFEAEGSDMGSDHWVVQLTGVARQLSQAQAEAASHEGTHDARLDEWPQDVSCRHVYIPAAVLDGSRSTPAT